ncbi:hypothetical protein AK812_SmicGene37628 [Symbiodinium microadriaticum]|uniref:Uncharacterized protein n=1 Tax=Symbiodinium microadriaticum TaxID=2951 RepID=A0A1Q9CFX7_SYMMI|nr:hypothetical protein AK812_SmicGene37628 [Symbiodinium microadriaticum]
MPCRTRGWHHSSHGHEAEAERKPYLAEVHFGKTASVQTLRERKLRRAARRVAAAMEGGDNAGEAKLNCYPQHLADVFSDLGEVVRLQGPALLTFLQEKAAEEEKRANRARLDKWASCAEKPTSFEDFAADPDPQAKVEAAAVEWQHLWSRHRRHGVALRQLLTELQLDRNGHRAPPLRFAGLGLLQRGPLAATGGQVWNSTLDGASIPAASSASIAALAWRLGAACLVQLLGDWIGRVFPEELYGGLPGKSVDDVHAELTHDLYDSTCSVAVGLWLVARLTSGSVLTALPLTWRSTAFGRSGLHRLFWT